jgi:propionyl-CoA carboxylase alpha chain
MNTRLQVEHPVTELVTGIDLVEEMIRVASGEKLKLRQADVKRTGWAVESRIYAEDPTRNFLPSIGRLTRYRPPPEGSDDGLTVRIDTGVAEGGEISIYYDPMIAKLVTHAPTRPAAIETQAAALDAFYIDGIRHNIPFLAALMQHPRWRAGKLSTGFIGEEFAGGFKPRSPSTEEFETLAAVATVIDHLANQRRRAITQQMSGERVRFAERRVVTIAAFTCRLEVEGDDSPYKVRFIEGRSAAPLEVVSDWWPGEPVWSGRVGERDVAIQVRPLLNGYDLAYRGIHAPVRVFTEREAELAALMPAKRGTDTSKLLLCPMPGLVKSLAVAEGQEVKAGDPLAVVEAMKMENILRAERDGLVKAIRAKPGDSLAVDAVILEFA